MANPYDAIIIGSGAGGGVGFVEFEAERDGERVDAELADVGFDRGHAGFVGERRVGVGLGVEGLGGIVGACKASGDCGGGAEVAVDVEEFFGAGVVGFHVGVSDGPGGRDAALVLDLAEVFCAHTKEGGAIDFCLAADVVSLLWVEGLVVLVVPGFGGVVAVLEEDGGGVPVELFLGKEGAALEDEDAFASAREMESEGSAACAGADDDCVVWIRHGV